MLKITPVILLLSTLAHAGYYNFEREENDFSEVVSKACGNSIKFDLHDYEYGTDESSLYKNRHFQDCSLIKHLIAKACDKHPKNNDSMKKVSKIICQRGSMNERKILFRKNGELVFIIDSKPDREKVIEEGLSDAVGLDFKADFKVEQKEKSVAEEKAKAKNAEEKQVAKVDERNKKIADLTAWFQAEVQKLTKNPSPDMSQKLEKLSESYKEKLNEITSAP